MAHGLRKAIKSITAVKKTWVAGGRSSWSHCTHYQKREVTVSGTLLLNHKACPPETRFFHWSANS